MKKIISIGLLGLMSYAYAWDASEHIELTDEQKNEIFTKHGLPWPGMGAQVVPASSMSESIKAKIKKNSLSIAKKGYIDEENSNAKTLLEIKKLAQADLVANLDIHNPKSTHMRAHAKEVYAGYEYNGVPSKIVSQVIGFSAIGAYIDGKGWTGVIEFFEPNDLPETTCSYSQSNLKLTGGTASIAQETASYVVNDKISVVEVIGNNKTAFGYTVEWYDDNYRSVLTCAQKTYSKETINKAVAMAKVIDRAV